MIPYTRKTLPNGLTVVVNRDRASKLAAVNILYRVGARNENPARTGFAHLFEHLMFRGTRAVENFDLPVQMASGDNNAFTNNDYTDFYITLPKDNLETALWLESDRMDTMEEGGVNGNSMLPHSPALLRELAESHPAPPSPVAVQNPLSARVWKAIAYYAGTIFLRPFFPCFRTHRPQSAVSEVWGWFLRVLTRRTWERHSAESVREIYRSRAPYFLFPLQLDSDSQVRRYSPFSGMKEAIAHVLTSFAHSAPKSMHLLIRNHPLDNGLINYRRYIRRFSHACGLEGRVHFVESGRAALMMDRSEGMVVLNSTIGISGLQRGIPVYCVGTSIYAVRGLASSQEEQDLDDFWSNPQKPCPETLRHFEKVLKCRTLINGNFYTEEGVRLAIQGVMERIA